VYSRDEAGALHLERLGDLVRLELVVYGQRGAHGVRVSGGRVRHRGCAVGEGREREGRWGR
jgi:hypothetical protein